MIPFAPIVRLALVEIEDNNANDVFDKNKDARTTSVSVNVFGNEHSRLNSLEHHVPIIESRHVSLLDESELTYMTKSNSVMTRVPLETTPLKIRHDTDTDETYSEHEEDQIQADAHEVQLKPSRRVLRLDYAELNVTGRKLMEKKEKKKVKAALVYLLMLQIL